MALWCQTYKPFHPNKARHNRNECTDESFPNVKHYIECDLRRHYTESMALLQVYDPYKAMRQRIQTYIFILDSFSSAAEEEETHLFCLILKAEGTDFVKDARVEEEMHAAADGWSWSGHVMNP